MIAISIERDVIWEVEVDPFSESESDEKKKIAYIKYTS